MQRLRLAAGALGTLGADVLSERSGFPITFAIFVAPSLFAAVGTRRAVAPDTTSVGVASASSRSTGASSR